MLCVADPCMSSKTLRNLPLLSHTYRFYSRVMWDEWYNFLTSEEFDMRYGFNGLHNSQVLYSSVCYGGAPWRVLQLKVNVTCSGNRMHSHDCCDQGGFCPCIVHSAILWGSSGSYHANHSFCFQIIWYMWYPVVLKLTPSDTQFPRRKPAWLIWEKNY